MEEVTHSEELGDPVREPIKGRTIILGDWFTYRGKRYKVVNIRNVVDLNERGLSETVLRVTMETAR